MPAKKKAAPYRQTPKEDREELGNIRKWGKSEQKKHPQRYPREAAQRST